MKLWQKFTNSVYKFDEYYRLLDTSARSSLGFYFLISLLTVIIMSFSLFPVISQMFGEITAAVPEFTIENGRLNADDTIDINNDGTVIRVDASAENVEELEPSEDYVQGIFVGATEMIVISKLNGMNERAGLDIFEGMTNEELAEFMGLLSRVIYFFIVIFLFLQKAVLLLLLLCIAKLMSNLMRGGLNLKDALKLGVYASTTAVIIKAVLYAAGVSMPNFIFYGIVIVYMYLGIDSCKKHRLNSANQGTI
ncbi:MAG: DUF1189 domain-containing protein [Clostridiales bacterium]|nr:DUF1189 domain-containing protein [Clostridiales bacterium]